MMIKSFKKKIEKLKQRLAQNRESTAMTLARELNHAGVLSDQIRSEHILGKLGPLKKLKSAPDFAAIQHINIVQEGAAVDNCARVYGVIVETREHPNLEFVVNNFIDVTGCPVQLFHGSNNLEYIMATTIAERVQKGEVALACLNADQLDAQRYNALLLSKKFWDSMIGRQKILVFQTDSILCEQSDFNLEDFSSFDYIGSNWPRLRPVGIVADGGNGGLSLRDWQRSYDCLDRFPPVRWYAGEDGYFAFHIELIGGKVGSQKDCAKFSTGQKFLFKSFGAHGISALNRRDLSAFLDYCPEARLITNKAG